MFQMPNHPRVGVSWYEAMAYCHWLSEKLGLPAGSIALPSEAEWERAAGGVPGRRFPWGDAEDFERRCNWEKTKIGHTCAVGLFPAGDTPHESGNSQGVADLAGNVDEWCRTPRPNDHKDCEKEIADDLNGNSARVLHGASWRYNSPCRLQSSVRDSNAPDSGDDYIGFRVAWVGASALSAASR